MILYRNLSNTKWDDCSKERVSLISNHECIANCKTIWLIWFRFFENSQIISAWERCWRSTKEKIILQSSRVIECTSSSEWTILEQRLSSSFNALILNRNHIMIQKCCQIVSISKSNYLRIHEILEIFLSRLRHCFLIEFKSESSSIIKRCNAFVQLFRNLHINHSFHMILNYLTTIVKQDKRISMLQKWQKSIHDRNSFEAFKITSLSKMCLLICELALILKLCTKFFWKNSRANLWKFK